MKAKIKIKDNILLKSDVSWDEYFMRAVYLASSKSLDPRTRIGAVLVRDKNIIGTGYNGFPRGVRDLEKRYNDRETKYEFIAHSEFNAIVTAARLGVKTEDSVLFTNGLPCSGCMKAVIQAGVKEIVLHKQWPNLDYSEKWVESAKISQIMLEEAGLNVRWFDGELRIESLLDGKIIKV